MGRCQRHTETRTTSQVSSLCFISPGKRCFWIDKRYSNVYSNGPSNFRYNSSIRLELKLNHSLHFTQTLLTCSCPASPRLCPRRVGDVLLCNPYRRNYLPGRIPDRDIPRGRRRDNSHSTTTCHLKVDKYQSKFIVCPFFLPFFKNFIKMTKFHEVSRFSKSIVIC